MNRFTSAILVVLVLALAGGFYAARVSAISSAEQKMMLVHRNGRETPAQFGAAWTPFTIDSEGRRLQASLVKPQAPCAKPVALLIFHGRDESLSDWAKAQAFLGEQCVSSIVFDYSGNGDSTGRPTVANLNADALAAYAVFVQKFPSGRRCVLGHSMGNAPMLHGFPSFTPAPDCVVVANAFSAVEDFARTGGAPSFFALLLHGVWDNTEALRLVNAPLMIVHSDADKIIPVWMAQRLDETGAAPGTFTATVQLHGFSHDALYETPALEWWGPVLAFLRG